MNICARIGQRIHHELRYYIRKISFCTFSATKIDRDKYFRKIVEKHFQNTTLHVFLNNNLAEIDRIIETSPILKEGIVSEGKLVMQNIWLVLNDHRTNMFDDSISVSSTHSIARDLFC